jgi:acetyltransferase
LFRPGPTGSLRGYRPEALFKPRSVLLVAPGTALGCAIAANMVGFSGTLDTAEPGAIPDTPFDMAVLACRPDEVADVLVALGQAGIGAVVCATPAPGLADAARVAGVRVLGPSSFGLIVPAIGLNASTAHVPVLPGRVALVSQSAALCRAVLDWAAPNGVGFSHVVGTGGNAQTGFSAVLDWLSRDPGTGAILLDIRTIRDRRSFLAAARAAARLRPVVAIRAGNRLTDPTGRADQVFDSALRRAGIVRVTGLANFLGAAEVLTRARPPRTENLAIATNAIGPAHMAADAAVAAGLPLLELDAVARTVLSLRLPEGPNDPGIVWTGSSEPTRLADAVAMLGGVKETGGIVAILAPTGPADAAAVQALAATKASLRVPLLACVLGETTGAVHRRTLADAGLPVFATPESAVRAFDQLVQQRRARAAAAELPPRRVLRLAPDRNVVRRILEHVRADGRRGLAQDEALAVLSAYGMPVVPSRAAISPAEAADAAVMLGFPVVLKRRRITVSDRSEAGDIAIGLPARDVVERNAQRMQPGLHGYIVQRQAGRARELRITVADDRVFGPAIGFGLGGTAADLLGDVALELPPLNLALARGLIARTRAAALLGPLHDQPAADREAVADALVRVSQLLVDHPEIEAIDINPLFADADGVSAADAWVGLRPVGEAARFTILAYPEELSTSIEAGDETLLIRPIRPEDAEAHAALFRRLSPEDVRYRFFNALRELSPEQIARMTQVDYDREMAFIAVREGTGDTVGVARLVWEPGTTHGEFAVVVDPAMKGRGLARHLMNCIAQWGRTQGMTEIIGQVLAENRPMLAFMRKMGATIRRMPDELDVVEAVIPVG